ncbi:unnamed protein product [Orchesella dallaii]|uniref:Protein kinase domain-containing protein n=1 Tax=Orchesella dallaii TaxID=48710 RepID=A0ABP1PJQ0_9HEXA
MITKISTKFSKLMMPCISRAEKETGTIEYFNLLANLSLKKLFITDSRVGIPSAVATFNKLHRNPQQPPLELLMTFTYFYMYSGNESISFIFDFAKELADGANEIYNGTVKWLYFDYDSLSDNTIEEAHTYLAHAQNVLNRNGYEVGAVLPMDNCGGSSEILANYTLRILPLVRKIIFHFWPTQQSLSLGPDTAVPHLTKSFVQCIETIRKYDSSLQVGFQTRWDNPSPNADEDEAKNYRDLVQFWQTMNAWAIEYNTTVVLLEAFDNPWKYDGNKNLGWWRLIQNASYYNSSQYVFQEKQIAISNRKIPTDADATLIFRVVLGTTSALVFFTLLALVALYRPLRKRFSKDRVRSKYLREFYEGAPETLIEGDTKGIPGIQRTAYRKDLELPKAAFKIDWKSTLGTGAFGAVCRGAIKRVNDEKEIQVAVKTTKLSSPVTALKSILSEIKVMSYVDKHSNIVGLLGAYTTELKKGDRILISKNYTNVRLTLLDR